MALWYPLVALTVPPPIKGPTVVADRRLVRRFSSEENLLFNKQLAEEMVREEPRVEDAATEQGRRVRAAYTVQRQEKVVKESHAVSPSAIQAVREYMERMSRPRVVRDDE